MNPDQPLQKTVVCPTCGGPSIYAPGNRFRPFCSERCKNVDLGAWASEGFRLPADAPPDDQVYGDARLQ
ncbi:DNA gyrase inhibitor YacG [Polaromonas sp.]|uniref:DNA gyrase inhibitor YacG n=1 Tax=Polaromonas sp. TaxID=1869339 RepID=UPI00248938A1|nr:DNA gyrase inhibitor YacG [Polaromonas sp.]MDI1275233.1 DNA gyrase inhibitor YacG [Polaromonas sp.]